MTGRSEGIDAMAYHSMDFHSHIDRGRVCRKETASWRVTDCRCEVEATGPSSRPDSSLAGLCSGCIRPVRDRSGGPESMLRELPQGRPQGLASCVKPAPQAVPLRSPHDMEVRSRDRRSWVDEVCTESEGSSELADSEQRVRRIGPQTSDEVLNERIKLRKETKRPKTTAKHQTTTWSEGSECLEG